MRTLACILCLAACDAGAKPEPAPVQPPANKVPLRQPVATSAFNLEYLPADSDVVVHVDVATLRKSKLWPSYSHDVAKLVVAGFNGCDYDPMTQMSSVDIGIRIPSGYSVYVIRGIDRAKSLECFHRIEKEPDRAMFDGDFFTLTSVRSSRVMTFVDDHTLVMEGAEKPTKAMLQQVIEAGAPLRKDAAFVGLLDRTKKAGISAVSRPGSVPLAKSLKESSKVDLGYFYGTLDLTDRLDVQYVMTLGTAAEATTLAKTMKEQFDNAGVKQMFDRVESRAQDKTVTLDVAMSETKLASLAGMVRGMIPEP